MSRQLPIFKALVEITRLDWRQTKRWFGKNTASKIIVVIAYLSLLVAVGLGIFYWSSTFFKYLIGFEKYGLFTSEYILKGAFVILIWVGILSSMIGTISFLLTPNRYTDYLLTLPISEMSISIAHTIRSLFTNTFLFLVSIFPLILGFVFSQNSGTPTTNLIGPFIALITLVFLTQSLGSSFAYLVTFLTKKKYGFWIGFVSLLALVSATWLVVRMVFPPELKLLDSISPEKFDAFFNQLPLNSRCWLGNSFLAMVTNFSLQSVFLLIFTSITFVISLILQSKLFLPCWQSARTNVNTTPSINPYVSPTKINLVTKELLSIFRSMQNLGYGLFLMIMMVTFFGLFSRGYLVGTISERFRIDAISFSFAWLVFFSGTFLLRFVYPLMVNEGRSRWWFFTIPIKASKSIGAKITASLLLSIPLYLVALAEWYLVPFAIQSGFLVILSILAITFLGIVIPLFGSLNPDYSLAFDADRASTSFTGIISLISIIATGSLGSYLIQMSLRQGLRSDIALNAFFAFTLLVTSVLWFLSVKATSEYKLDS